MKIFVELPEATKDETAYVKDNLLHIQYHAWNPDLFYYVDREAAFPLDTTVSIRIVAGPRKGFKRCEILAGSETLSLSKRHKGVINKILRSAKGFWKVEKVIEK